MTQLHITKKSLSAISFGSVSKAIPLCHAVEHREKHCFSAVKLHEKAVTDLCITPCSRYGVTNCNT